jgi:hypothetical protein
MSQSQARAWWADVEHLREEFEERRDDRRPALRLVGESDAPAAGPVDAPVAPRGGPGRSPSGRRTVTITGRPAEPRPVRPLVEIERRRPAAPAAERFSARPDRLAAWAVVLGLVLVLVATLTSGA